MFSRRNMRLTEGIDFHPEIIGKIEKDLAQKNSTPGLIRPNPDVSDTKKPLPEFGKPIEMMEKPNPDDKPDFQFIKKQKMDKNVNIYFNKIMYTISGSQNKEVSLFQISNNLLGAVIDGNFIKFFPNKILMI